MPWYIGCSPLDYRQKKIIKGSTKHKCRILKEKKDFSFFCLSVKIPHFIPERDENIFKVLKTSTKANITLFSKVSVQFSCQFHTNAKIY